ncbi:hypothetical protein OSB04_003054 [Centaurea solstitialis]|uniref:Integrase catalytic domain-containing protein n=1 Tax=Centaurea solstitialis TaxID=347529 RepID=A0AA38TU36_9ASTR|nr:hypothetical protein OSB04_003054 [Centaurea solstitialis]
MTPQLHGYPDWWEDRTRAGKGSGNNHTSATGTAVSKHGKAGGLHVNAVTSHNGGTSNTEAVSFGPGGASLANLTPEQVQILLNLVNSRQQDQTMGEYYSLSWIIDTESLCAIEDQRTRSLIGAGEQKDGLYYYHGVPSVCMTKVLEISEFELWHRRMGHPSDRLVKLVPALRSSTFRKSLNKACDVCPQAKQTRESFPNSDSKSSRIFELIHCDLWGPYKIPSSGGAHYFLTLVDDFSRAVWVYLLHSKTEVYKAFCSFFAMITQQFEVQVKLVRSDNGSEFKCMVQYFAEHGIVFQTSCVGTPQQNGRVECKHQHILNVGRALMFQDKFAPRSRKCVFIGYPHGKKGWKLYDLGTGEIFVSRDVKFHENEFPFANTQESLGVDTRDSEPSDKGMMNDEFLDDLENDDGGCLDSTQNTETTQQPTADDVGEVVVQPATSTHDATEQVLGHGQRTINEGLEPRTFHEAMKHPGWREAMQKEIEALEGNEAWEMEELPPGKKALGCKWVYKIKGLESVDYNETFAPVANMVTVRAFLSVAAAKNWELHQMDVHNAFLHGDLDEEVYMKLPPGFDVEKTGKVCRLKKSLYGLRQAPGCWFAKLAASLKRLGVLKYFLGIEVARSPEGIFLCQRKYTLDIIAEAGLLGAKPAGFPIEQNHHLAVAKGSFLDDPEKYRRLVGRLIYLSFTRPDLAYTVHILAQFMQQPRQEHWDAALRTVCYLKGCPGQGILLRADCDLCLTGWCDSDWASCPLTRRSITSWFVFFGGSPISWKTKKQHIVSCASAEAEYRKKNMGYYRS